MRDSFYRNLDLKRAILMSSPFWLAAAAAQDLNAAVFNATDVTSLRAAVASANASGTSDTINIAAGTYDLGAGGELLIDKAAGNLDIIGAGSGSTLLSGSLTSRVLHIDTNNVASTFTIQNLSILNGQADDDGTGSLAEARGAGLLLERAGTGVPPAGFNLTLTGVVIGGCDAVATSGASGVSAGAGQPGSNAAGGAIWMEGGTLNLNGCTLDNNRALGGSGGDGGSSGGNGGDGGNASGGALFIEGGTVNISNSTLSNNDAWGGPAGSGQSSLSAAGGHSGDGGIATGGAIYLNAGTLQVTGNSILTNNNALGGNGDWGGTGGTATGGGARVGGNAGIGGLARGGALFVVGGTVTLTDADLVSNGAYGGAGGQFAGNGGDGGTTGAGGADGGNGGVGGDGEGGGLYVDGGSVTLNQCLLDSNGAGGGQGYTGADGGSGSSAAGGNGGFGGFGGAGRGGGIFADNGSTVVINESSIIDSNAQGGNGGDGGWGGDGSSARGGPGGPGGVGGEATGAGLYVDSGNASVTLNACTLSGNDVLGGNGGDGGRGGDGDGVAGRDGGNGGTGGTGGAALGAGYYRLGGTTTLTIRNSTVSGNDTSPGNGGNGGTGGVGLFGGTDGFGGDGASAGQSSGAGIYLAAGTTNIYNSTVASNAAQQFATAGAGGTGSTIGVAGTVPQSRGGGLHRAGGTAGAFSTIFANNTATTNPDTDGTYSASNCLIENGQAPASGTANVLGQDPGLVALANNGGPTLTHAITGGPALDAGSNPLGLASDQRGFGRTQGADTDIGSFELGAGAAVTPPPVVTDPASAVLTNAASYDVQGTASPDSLVQVYFDNNNNNVFDGGDTVGPSQLLSGGATAFNINVTLAANSANNLIVTADDGTNGESTPTDVPTITHDNIAPTGTVITDPASAVNTVGTTYDIHGTAEADALVRVYNDANDNGAIDIGDNEVASGTATGGNFSITTPILQGTANNFVATAEDTLGNVSTPVNVPTITETTAVTAPPVVTTPSAPVTVDQPDFDIQGTAVADSLVRVYADTNNNGIVDPGEATPAGSQQLTGGATSFSVNVTLSQSNLNNFLVTADDATNAESNPVDVPTITETGGGGGGPSGGGDDGGGGGCSTDKSRFNWLLFGGIFAAAATALRNLLRRRKLNA